ncbi:hypothetical protein AAFC00_000997 [Neodothiora populina]|uniref:Zn(2)-C6 fungal-type domain-containing protein n=1 Tax=Neodothiora populina TaxID=2781224 RepID=A0ABR3PMG2_9PEZI
MITHRKTRTGCVQCKQRRIKCDETKPRCEKCRRTNRECSFQSVGTPNPAVSHSTGPNSNDVFTVKEMELLHHFIMQTGPSLVNSSALQRVWQTGVIDLALKNTFLMHTVLSLSAMHLAYLRQNDSAAYSVQAANHQDVGLAGFRAELQQFSENNCHALFASSILVIFYIPASSGTSINDDMASSFLHETLFVAIIDWIRLIRGCHHIIERGRRWLEQGPTALLVPRRAWYSTTEPLDERARVEDRYLASLERLWAPDTPTHMSTYDNEELEAYKDALIKLRQTFARMSHAADGPIDECVWCSPHGEVTPGALDGRVPRIVAGVLWSMLIPEKFFELLEQRRPIALILLAHNAIIVKRTSKQWWNKAPAMKTITAVTATLHPQYHAWIEWPQREIGFTTSEEIARQKYVNG